MKRYRFSYPALLASSTDDQRLSLTIQGLIAFLIPLAVFIARRYGYTLTFTEQDIIDLSVIVASAVTLYGLIRKFWVKKKGETTQK